jgi:hypothetical protein
MTIISWECGLHMWVCVTEGICNCDFIGYVCGREGSLNIHMCGSTGEFWR